MGNTSAAKIAMTAEVLIMTPPSYCGGCLVDNLGNAYWTLQRHPMLRKLLATSFQLPAFWRNGQIRLLSFSFPCSAEFVSGPAIERKARTCCMNSPRRRRGFPQGLKPQCLRGFYGTTKVVPFHEIICATNPSPFTKSFAHQLQPFHEIICATNSRSWRLEEVFSSRCSRWPR